MFGLTTFANSVQIDTYHMDFGCQKDGALARDFA